MEAIEAVKGTIDILSVREDFPALHQEVNGHPLVYFDNAATSQKPQAVIDRLVRYYAGENSNVHRGAHLLSRRATRAYEDAREFVRAHIGAASAREIVFTSGTTDSINLVAATMGGSLSAGSEIIVSGLEHHSNLVPWQMLCRRSGARLRVIPVTETGQFDVDGGLSLFNERTAMVALSHVSNALGTINPVEAFVSVARARNIPVLLDGAQAIPHLKVDVRALDCDFYCFSGHKAYGPTGIGVLFGRMERLEEMEPYRGGGEMISSVSFETSTWAEPPYRFEAGTPHIAGAVGLAEALRYIQTLGFEAIEAYEKELLAYASGAFQSVEGLTIVGSARRKVPVISFLIDGVHPLDLGTLLDTRGIAMRTGHHCAEPLMRRFGISGTVRASLAFYNTREEVDRAVDAIQQALRILR